MITFSGLSYAPSISLAPGVPGDASFVGFGASLVFGAIPTPTPNEGETFAADDLCVAFAAQRTNANAITFASPWTLRIARIATQSSTLGGMAVGTCRYGDAVFGASQFASTSATGGNCGLVVLRNCLLSNPIGDHRSVTGTTTTINTPSMALLSASANIVFAVHYRRGAGAVSLGFPGAPLTETARVDDGFALGSMAFGRTGANLTAQGPISASVISGAADRFLLAVEIRRAA